MPIITAVDAAIKHGADPKDAVRNLMGRDSKTELPKPILDLNFESAVIKKVTVKAKGVQTMKRVITYGSFDLLHYGHINLLRRAKALGDYLIVGVTTQHFDEARGKVNVMDPIMTRIENVKKTGFADEIIVEDHDGQKIEDI